MSAKQVLMIAINGQTVKTEMEHLNVTVDLDIKGRKFLVCGLMEEIVMVNIDILIFIFKFRMINVKDSNCFNSKYLGSVSY